MSRPLRGNFVAAKLRADGAAVARKIVFLSSFPFSIEGGGVVCPRLITQDMEQCSKDVVSRRDGRTGLEVRSKEDVHDQRVPTGVGVCISLYDKKIKQEHIIS